MPPVATVPCVVVMVRWLLLVIVLKGFLSVDTCLSWLCLAGERVATGTGLVASNEVDTTHASFCCIGVWLVPMNCGMAETFLMLAAAALQVPVCVGLTACRKCPVGHVCIHGFLNNKQQVAHNLSHAALSITRLHGCCCTTHTANPAGPVMMGCCGKECH